MVQILVTFAGPDRPGISAALLHIVSDQRSVLLDVEQVVVRGQLTFCLLLAMPDEPARSAALLGRLTFAAREMGLDMQSQEFRGAQRSSAAPQSRARYVVTAMAEQLEAAPVATLAAALAQHGANIDAIRRLSHEALASLEFVVSLPVDSALDESELQALRRDLWQRVADLGVDVAVQRENLARRAKRLVVLDMDSTLVQVEVIDELARLAGVYDAVAGITERAMQGELSFEQSLSERVAQLAGLEMPKVLQLAAALPLTQGAEALVQVLHRLGYKTAVISGGFTFATDALKQRLGLDYAFANQLEVAAGRLTGKVLPPIVGPQRKADLFEALAQREGIPLEQTIAIGDGANDLLMLQKAGLGIAFHAKPKLRAAADATVTAGGLDRILHLLGFSWQEVEEFLHAPR